MTWPEWVLLGVDVVVLLYVVSVAIDVELWYRDVQRRKKDRESGDRHR